MDDILETDENFEIVASTLKCIYDQTCRKCGSQNRVIFYQLREGRVQRKLRIEHGKGDTRPTFGTARKNKSVKATRSRPRPTNDCEKEALATTTLGGQKVDGGTTTATMTLARDLAAADNGATDSIASKTGPRAFFWTPFAV